MVLDNGSSTLTWERRGICEFDTSSTGVKDGSRENGQHGCITYHISNQLSRIFATVQYGCVHDLRHTSTSLQSKFVTIFLDHHFSPDLLAKFDCYFEE